MAAPIGRSPLLGLATGGDHEVLFGDPAVAAAADAAKTLAESVSWNAQPLLNTVVIGPESHVGDRMTGRVGGVLDGYPRLMLRRGSEVASALNTAEWPALFQDNDISIDVRAALSEAFGPAPLLVVRVLPSVAADNVVLVPVRADIYAIADRGPTAVQLARLEPAGLRRDVRRWPGPIALLAVGLLGISFFVVWMLRTPGTPGTTGTTGTTASGLSWAGAVRVTVAFLIGAATVFVGLQALSPIMPRPSGPYLSGVWWTSLGGVVCFAAPAVVATTLMARLAAFFPGGAGPVRGAHLGAVSGLGATAALTPPAVFWAGWSGIGLLAALAPGAAALGLLAAAGLDQRDRTPTVWLAASVVLAAGLGVGWMSGAVVPVVVVSTFAVAAAAWALRRHGFTRHRVESDGFNARPRSNATPDDTSAEQLVGHPRYITSPVVDQLVAELQAADEGRCTWVLVRGPRGTGKTRAVGESLDAIARHHDTPPAVIHVRGEEARRDIPYGAIGPALGRAFGLSVGRESEEWAARVSLAVGGAFGLLVPFSSLLFSGSAEGADGSIESPAEIHRAVAAALRHRTNDAESGRPLLVWVCEDAQWLDAASAQLLLALTELLPPDSPHRLAVIVCVSQTNQAGIPGDTIDELSLRDGVHLLPATTWPIDLTRQLLSDGIGLSPGCARRVADHANNPDHGLHSPLELTRHLLETDRLTPTPSGLDLGEAAADHPLPSPRAMVREARRQLHEQREHRLMLEAAAVIGYEFGATELAEVLGWSKLTLIHTLRELEHRTGLVVDVRDRDDVYRFGSRLLFNILFEDLGLFDTADTGTHRPQLTREIHARIARTLAEKPTHTNDEIYRLAQHTLLAGQSHAHEAWRWNRRAAALSLRQAEFEAAGRYLGRGERAAAAAGLVFDGTSDRVILDCETAHIRGEDPTGAAERGLDHLQSQPTPSEAELVVVMRAAWECGRYPDKQRAMEVYQRGLSLLREVCDSSKYPVAVQAEAMHLMGRVELRKPQTKSQGRQRLEEAIALIEPSVQAAAAEDAEPRTVGTDAQTDSVQSQAARLLDPRHTWARLINSLTNHLIYEDDTDRDAAREWIDRAIELRRSALRWDRKGLGIALGVRGRLHLMAGRLGPAAADMRANLEISEAIGDRLGVSFMRSELAQVLLLHNQPDEALQHAETALEASGNSRVSRYFSLCRCIRAAAAAGALETARRYAAELTAAFQNGMQVVDPEELKQAQRACEQAAVAVDWNLDPTRPDSGMSEPRPVEPS